MITRLQEEKDALPEKQENQNKIQKLLTDISGTTNNIKDFVKESKNEPIDIKSIEKKLGIIGKKLKTIENKFKDSSRQDTKKKRDFCNKLCEFWNKMMRKSNEERADNESIYLNSYSVYDEFRKRYSSGFAPLPKPYLCITMIIYFISLFILFFVYNLKLSQGSITCLPQCSKSILVLSASFLCTIFYFLFIYNEKSTRKIQYYITLILVMWMSTVILMGLNYKETSSKVVFLFDLFFFSFFVMGIIKYDYEHYTDNSRQKAEELLVGILKDKDLDDQNVYTYDLLVNDSATIEDSFVSAIRMAMNWISRSSFIIGLLFGANIEAVKKLFESINISALKFNEDIFFYQMWFMDFLLFFAVFLFLVYTSYNWKANLYKLVLKDKQFMFALKRKTEKR